MTRITIAFAAVMGWFIAGTHAKGGHQRNHKNQYTFQALGIDTDRIPPSIKHVKLPEVRLNEDAIEFEIPDDVKTKLFTEDQTQVLKGACKKSFEAYEDGTRMDAMKNVLGQEAYDMVVEYVLYDYLLGDCNWIDTYFGEIVGEWGYVPKEHSGIFEHLSESGSVASEAINYFSYWLQNQANNGRTLMMDGVLAWKLKVAESFARLKKVHNLKNAGPGNLAQLKCERVNPVNFFREPQNDAENYQDLSEDEESLEDDDLEDPNAKRVDEVVDFISHREQNDVSGPSSRKKEDPDWEPNPTGYTIQITMMVDVCMGMCVKIGAGLSWNAITEEEFVHWSYGLGSLDSHSSVQDVRMQVAHFCETTIEFGNIWHVGYVTAHNTAFNHMYTENWEEFLGISYDIGYNHPYEADAWNEETKMHFAWHHTKKLAKRSLAATVQKKRNIKKLQDEGIPDSEIAALQESKEDDDAMEEEENGEEIEENEIDERKLRPDGLEWMPEAHWIDNEENPMSVDIYEDDRKRSGFSNVDLGRYMVADDREDPLVILGGNENDPRRVTTHDSASNLSLNIALALLAVFFVIGGIYWCFIMHPDQLKERMVCLQMSLEGLKGIGGYVEVTENTPLLSGTAPAPTSV